MNKKRGGARPNSGPKKGAVYQKTLDKLAAREVARQLITAKLEPLIDAQIANAGGLKYLVTRDKKTGKFLRVGSAQAAKPNEETIEVWEKDPCVQAFTDLMNRALDKPSEPVQQHDVSGALTITWQDSAS